MRNDFDDVISLAFVEGNGGGIIDGCLETNGLALGGTQSFFGGREQNRAYTLAAGSWANIDGDDVSDSATATLGDDEGEDRKLIRW